MAAATLDANRKPSAKRTKEQDNQTTRKIKKARQITPEDVIGDSSVVSLLRPRTNQVDPQDCIDQIRKLVAVLERKTGNDSNGDWARVCQTLYAPFPRHSGWKILPFLDPQVATALGVHRCEGADQHSAVHGLLMVATFLRNRNPDSSDQFDQRKREYAATVAEEILKDQFWEAYIQCFYMHPELPAELMYIIMTHGEALTDVDTMKVINHIFDEVYTTMSQKSPVGLWDPLSRPELMLEYLYRDPAACQSRECYYQ